MGAAASVDSVNVSNGFAHRNGTPNGHGSTLLNRRRSATSTASSASSGVSSLPGAPSQSELFRSLVDTKFSFETAYAKVEPVMQELAKFASARTDVITPALDFLFSYTSSKYGADISRMWVEKLEKNNLVPIVMKLWPSFWDPDLLQCASKDSGNGVQKDNITLENFWFVCRIIWNGSDCSSVLCRALVATGTIEEMLKIVARKDFDPAAMKKDEVRSYISKAATGIVHNCLRNCYDEAKTHFLDAKGIDILMPYMTSDLPLLATKSTVVLSYVAQSDEQRLCECSDDMIKTILRKLLEPGLARSSRKSHGFTTIDSLTALNHLAEIDQNKHKLVQHGTLPLCMKIMERPDSDTELQHTVRLVWTMSFNEHTWGTFKGMPALLAVLDKLRAHNVPAISRAATGTLWNVNGKMPESTASRIKRTHSGPPGSKRSINVVRNSDIPVFGDRHSSARSLPISSTRRRPPTTLDDRKSRSRQSITDIREEKEKVSEHVLICYDHAHKSLVIELNRALKEAGYVTWLDAERTGGHTLESSVEAIEQAVAICVCISGNMINSLTCRTELEYARRQCKELHIVQLDDVEPSGWLHGIVQMSDKRVIKCTSSAGVPKCVTRLADRLGVRARIPQVEDKKEEAQEAKHNESVPKPESTQVEEKPKEKLSDGKNAANPKHHDKLAKRDVKKQESKVETAPVKDVEKKAESKTEDKSHSSASKPDSRRPNGNHNLNGKSTRHHSRKRADKDTKNGLKDEKSDVSEDGTGTSGCNGHDQSSEPTKSEQQVADTNDIEEKPDPAAEEIMSRPTSAWSRNHVQKWLDHNGLSHLSNKFEKFDGGLLLELRAMYHKSPNVFYQNARDDLGMGELSDMLRMTQLLDQIQPDKVNE